MSHPKRAAARVAEELTKAELRTKTEEDEDEANDSSYESGHEQGGEKKTMAPKKTRKSSKPEGLCLSDEEEEQAANQVSAGSSRGALVKRPSVGVGPKKDLTNSSTETNPKASEKSGTSLMSLESSMGLGAGDAAWKKRVGSVLSNLNKPRKVSKKVKLDRTVSRILAGTASSSVVSKERLQVAAKRALANTGSVKVTKKVEFAGEHIEVTKIVEKSSKDAELAAAHEDAEKAKKVSALDQLVDGLTKRTGINTVQKSNFDWQKYKADKNIQEELEQKTKDGYVEKQDFLQRVDLRQFELEKQAREAERAKRDASNVKS